MSIKYKKTLFIAACLGLLLASAALAQTAEQNTYARLVKSGSEQMKNSDYQAARDSFTEALRYDDSGFFGHLGLGMAYFHLRDDNAAERELTKAAELNPKEPAAYRFLGEIYYRRDDLETAASYWEKAAGLNPADSGLRARLERIRKEHKTEKDFNRDVTSHFLVKYEGREKIEAGRIILRVLEDAYGEVGRALSYYPDQRYR